jgi:hypothetical protein
MEWSRFAKVARSVLNINNPISAITISGGKIMSVSPLSSHLLTDSSQQQWKIPFAEYVMQLSSVLQSGTCRTRRPPTQKSSRSCRPTEAHRFRKSALVVRIPSRTILRRWAKYSRPAISARRRAHSLNCRAPSRPKRRRHRFRRCDYQPRPAVAAYCCFVQ